MQIVFNNLGRLILAIMITTAGTVTASAQTPEPKAVPIPPRAGVPVRVKPHIAVVRNDGVTSEKALAVDPRVNVSLCVREGNVKINGWARNEVRVFVKDGSKFGFKVRQKSHQSGAPVWVTVAGFESESEMDGSGSSCLWGAEVQVDVPSGAAIELKGRETTTIVDSVRRASVKTVGGDITLRNVTEGVTASTYEGDVTIERADGPISLDSATGNITAFEAGPSEISDIFKAKTNSGAISLARLGHRQIEVYSISGSVQYNGVLSSGGLYNFGTQNGSIRLLIPKQSSATFEATYGFGAFDSEFPLKYLTDDNRPNAKRIVAAMGTGDATVRLTSTSGSIGIKGQTPQ